MASFVFDAPTPLSFSLPFSTTFESLTFCWHEQEWEVAALITHALGETVADLCMQDRQGKPLITWLKEALGREYLLLIDKEEGVHLSSLALLESSHPQNFPSVKVVRKEQEVKVLIISGVLE